MNCLCCTNGRFWRWNTAEMCWLNRHMCTRGAEGTAQWAPSQWNSPQSSKFAARFIRSDHEETKHQDPGVNHLHFHSFARRSGCFWRFRVQDGDHPKEDPGRSEARANGQVQLEQSEFWRAGAGRAAAEAAQGWSPVEVRWLLLLRHHGHYHHRYVTHSNLVSDSLLFIQLFNCCILFKFLIQHCPNMINHKWVSLLVAHMLYTNVRMSIWSVKCANFRHLM